MEVNGLLLLPAPAGCRGRCWKQGWRGAAGLGTEAAGCHLAALWLGLLISNPARQQAQNQASHLGKDGQSSSVVLRPIQ
jgi:hypothetical protein